MATQLTLEVIAQHMAALRNLPEALPADTADWLRTFAELVEQGNGPRTFDECLGMTKATGGQHSTMTSYRRAQRDQCIKKALKILTGESRRGTNRKAEMLQYAIETFNETCWPTWKNLAAPPEGAQESDAALFYATRSNGGPLPSSLSSAKTLVKDLGGVSDPMGVVGPIWPVK